MKAALYLRVSTLYQIDKDSLPMQETDLINYSRYVLGVEDYEIFQDAGYSGKDTERPAYQDMMNRIRNNEFTHLLVWKIDRISRNLLDFAGMYEELKKYNVTFVSKNEQFDTSSAMGEAMLNITLVFAELERKLTAERVAATMLSRASKGLFNGGRIPYGYKLSEEDKTLLINDSEASVVRLVFELYEKHKSQKIVADKLKEMGVNNRTGKPFSHPTISFMLKNPVYKGTLRYNRLNNGKLKPEKEWLLLDDNHDPIISKDQWELCNAIMFKNSKKDSSDFRKNVHTHLFSKLLKCDYCNKTMVAALAGKRRDGHNPSKYHCTNPECPATLKSILDHNVAKVVFQSIADIAQGKKVIATKQHETIPYTINGETVEVSYDYIEKERLKYQNALTRLNDLYVFSGMSEKDYLIKKKELEDKLKTLKKKKPATTKKIDDDFLKMASYFLINNEFLNKRKVNYRTIVDNVDKKMLKEFLQTIIHEAKIHDGKVVSITYANGATIVFT